MSVGQVCPRKTGGWKTIRGTMKRRALKGCEHGRALKRSRLSCIHQSIRQPIVDGIQAHKQRHGTGHRRHKPSSKTIHAKTLHRQNPQTWNHTSGRRDLEYPVFKTGGRTTGSPELHPLFQRILRHHKQIHSGTDVISAAHNDIAPQRCFANIRSVHQFLQRYAHAIP